VVKRRIMYDGKRIREKSNMVEYTHEYINWRSYLLAFTNRCNWGKYRRVARK